MLDLSSTDHAAARGLLPLSGGAAAQDDDSGAGCEPRRARLRADRAGWSTVCSRREGAMSSELLLDAAGRRRSPAAMPGHNTGHAPRNKGHVYRADPPTVDEIVAVMRQTPADRHGLRLRALIVVLWRGGLRIQEALSLIESDLDPRRGSTLIRRGKGNRRREVGIDAWAWSDPSRSVARRPRRAAGRCAVLRDRRTDPRAAVVSDRRAR